jgi:hypothetical protein
VNLKFCKIAYSLFCPNSLSIRLVSQDVQVCHYSHSGMGFDGFVWTPPWQPRTIKSLDFGWIMTIKIWISVELGLLKSWFWPLAAMTTIKTQRSINVTLTWDSTIVKVCCQGKYTISTETWVFSTKYEFSKITVGDFFLNEDVQVCHYSHSGMGFDGLTTKNY